MAQHAAAPATVPAFTPLTSAASLLAQATSLLESSDSPDQKAAALTQLKLAHSLLANLDPYLDKVSSPAPKHVQDLIDATLEHDWEGAYKAGKISHPLNPSFSAGAYESNFIGMLTSLVNAKNVLEVGMFTGTTTACIAHNLPKDGKVVALELDAHLRDFVTPLFEKSGLASRIDIRIGAASEAIRSLALEKQDDKNGIQEGFDLIFIDADKTGYKGYYDTILQSGLLRKGGLLVVDNTLYKVRARF